MKSEDTCNDRRMPIDLSVYKQLGFYQLIDSNGPRVRGYHLCRTCLKIVLVIVQFIVIFGVSGFFIESQDTAKTISNSFELIIILTNCTLSSLKMYTIILNADLIWNIFEITSVDFLRCPRRSKSMYISRTGIPDLPD